MLGMQAEARQGFPAAGRHRGPGTVGWSGECPSPEALPSVPLCFLICTVRIESPLTAQGCVGTREGTVHMHHKPSSHRHGTGELPDPSPAYTGGPMGSSRVRCYGTVLGLRVRGREVPRQQENLAHLGGRVQGETIAIDGQR